MSFLQQNQSQGQNRTCLKLRRGEGGKMTQTMYAHNKKNNKNLKLINFKKSLILNCLKKLCNLWFIVSPRIT
jgi:hypothetical protein